MVYLRRIDPAEKTKNTTTNSWKPIQDWQMTELTREREEREETYLPGAMARVAGLFQQHEYLPDQINIPVDQEEGLDD